jgi:hypothetical protein
MVVSYDYIRSSNRDRQVYHQRYSHHVCAVCPTEMSVGLRKRAGTEEELYQQRAGVEGTLSQGVRQSNLRQSRYMGFNTFRLRIKQY